jgi:xanthine dehydrogenase YagS FAD-binding subunit
VSGMLFELPPFEHAEAATVAEAVRLLGGGGPRAVVAGATDLLALMKDRVQGRALPMPEVLVNIKPIEAMREIRVDGSTVVIGAAVTLARLAASEPIRAVLPALAEAASAVGTTQLRAVGTLGGNLCQRPRCMYFRHPDYSCFRKGGRTCFAVTGEHRDYHAVLGRGKCVMAHPSDTACALVALGGEAVVAGPGGERLIPIEAFFAGGDATRETVLAPDELLVEVRVPVPAPGNRQLFLKRRVRHSADFALASVAVSVECADGTLREARLALGGVAPAPIRAAAAEGVLRGARAAPERFAAAADAALAGARPLARNGYKVELARALILRALQATAAG